MKPIALAIAPKGQAKGGSESVLNVTGFLERIFDLPAIDGTRCFRGEANSAWQLKPSVLRGLRPNAEDNILSELMAEASAEFTNDRTMFARLVRAQHYGLPTRLLDVSLNPLVGLFFACFDEGERSSNGRVRILDFKKHNIRYPDSDTVSLICNLSRLTDDERDELKGAGLNKKLSDEKFQSLPSAERLAQFVRMEKPYFSNKMRAIDFRKYFLVHPPKSNRRVIAQSGAFVAAGLLNYSSTKRIVSFESSDIVIASSSKADILRELDLLNINSRSMFPEIEYTSKYIKRRWEKEQSSDSEDLFGNVFD